VGSLFGGAIEDLSNATQQLAYDRGTNSKSKDRAMTGAVDAVKLTCPSCQAKVDGGKSCPECG
jgi:hypothetical protein